MTGCQTNTSIEATLFSVEVSHLSSIAVSIVPSLAEHMVPTLSQLPLQCSFQQHGDVANQC